MNDRLPSKHVVLLGIGHTNAHVLRMWGMQPIPGASLTCISDHNIATYSGMLPAVLAGQNSKADMEIDLVRLCSSVGARLLNDPVTGIDHGKRKLLFDARPAVPFDVLSIGIGSVPATDDLLVGRDQVLKIKPMQTFLSRLNDRTQTIVNDETSLPIRILVVGGGVAGVELSFCLSPFVRSLTGREVAMQLVTRSQTVLPEMLASTRRKVASQLQHDSIEISTDRSVVRVEDESVTFDDGTIVAADLVIWATGAVAPDALGNYELPLDDRGFIATDSFLQSISGQPIFAVGDTGTMVDHPLPKAGVYAVRQGPVLWDNIQRTLADQPLRPYVPQQSFLRLINTGNGKAIGQWKGLSFSGRWIMRLKDAIDTRFLSHYQPTVMDNDAERRMQCHGCGCKLGGERLAAALAESTGGGIKFEDAAQLSENTDSPWLASTDFFASPVDDGFLAGRISALHCASDLIATGAMPTHVLAKRRAASRRRRDTAAVTTRHSQRRATRA